MAQSITNMNQVWMDTNTRNSISMSVSTMGNGASANSSLLVFNVDGDQKFRIDTVGRVRAPYHPAFCISGNDGNVVTTAGSKLKFNRVIHNNGSHFNTSTYLFTAPVAGYYAFHGTFYFQSGTGASVCFQINGGEVGSPSPLCYIPSSDQYDNNGTLSAVYYLSASDNISIASRGTQSSTFYMAHCAFSGYLIA